ncbi:CGNR zinc finger domain-containing protein [Spirillospora sp. NPDC048819]|uniref:CGNR zinc finger domain-containing protein n=1 Tax=Spirillospora sp. NPDC048819 TaxID=3155268 RepID=UPI003401FCD1
MASDDVPDLYPSEPRPVRLMNTIWADKAGTHDALATVGQLDRWVRQCGIPTVGPLGEADLLRARELRDALRRLAATVANDERPAAVDAGLSVDRALATLNGFTAPSAPELRRDGEGGFHRDWRFSVDGFGRELAALALEAGELLSERPEVRIGACYGPGCVLYYHRSHPRRGWCSAGCGNRGRVARHYRRHAND